MVASFGLVKRGGDSAKVIDLGGLPYRRRGMLTMTNYLHYQQLSRNDELSDRMEDAADSFDDRPKTRRKQYSVTIEKIGKIKWKDDIQDLKQGLGNEIGIFKKYFWDKKWMISSQCFLLTIDRTFINTFH